MGRILKTLYSGELSATASNGAACVCQSSFTAVNCLGLTKQNGALIFDAKCDVPANLNTGTDNQIEITSSGHEDANEWGISSPLSLITLTTAYQTFRLPLKDAVTFGGELNTAAINFTRFYAFTKSGSGNTTLYYANIKVEYQIPTFFMGVF